MDTEIRAFKINICSILTSVQKSLSIQELNKDYQALEGKPIPYRKFGFGSLIELLQSLDDTVHLPENPNKDSIVSLIVSQKSSHLRLLVEKQKSASKSHKNRSCKNYNSSSNNTSNSTNGMNQGINKNYNHHRNGSNYFHRYNTSPKNQSQNEMNHTGYVTNELRQYLEKIILDNKCITLNQISKLVREHKDFPLLKAKNINDFLRLSNNFLRVNGTYVVLNSPTKTENESFSHINGCNKNTSNSPPLNSISLTDSSSYTNTIRSSETMADLEIKDVTDLLSKLTNDNQEDMNNSPKTLTTQNVKTHTNSNEIENHLQGENVNHILPEIEVTDVSLHVQQKLFSSDENSKTKMILSDIYSPSLFYLHTYTDDVKFTNLMDQMKLFYDENNTKYVVKSDHIVVGSTYVSSYTSFSNENKWFRVKVLQEVDLDILKVFHLDYGTVDFIPKTELVFLKKEFSYLPYQAICCCLTYYDEIKLIKPEVTYKFLELINKEPFLVQVDSVNVSDFCGEDRQILHVTLFQQINGSEIYININNELSICL